MDKKNGLNYRKIDFCKEQVYGEFIKPQSSVNLHSKVWRKAND